MTILDRLTEAVCIEAVEDRYVDACIMANPDMFSADAMEDYTIVDQPGNDVDTLAGTEFMGDIEIPDEDGYTPTAYDAYQAMVNPEIADEDVPDSSPLYEDDVDDDTIITDEELMAAETMDDILEMQWQRGQNRYFWETAPEPVEEGRLMKKVKDWATKGKESDAGKAMRQKKKELGYGGGIGYSLGRTARVIATPVVNFGKGAWKGLKGESSLMSPDEMEEAARLYAPEEYENFFEMEAGLTARDTMYEADDEVARHDAYMEPITFSQIAEQTTNWKPDKKAPDPQSKPKEIPDSKRTQ